MIPDIFTVTQEILDIGEGAINSLIHNFGKDCLCVFDAQVKTPCNNSIFNPITQMSTNRYNGTGPKPFAAGLCPVCHGTGFIAGQQNTQVVVQLLIDWTPKVSKLILDNFVKSPYDLVTVKGFVSDESYIFQSKYIILDYLNNKYNGNKFILFSEPIEPGNIIKNKYFTCFLQKYIN